MIRQLQSGDYCYCTNNVFLYYSGNLKVPPSVEEPLGTPRLMPRQVCKVVQTPEGARQFCETIQVPLRDLGTSDLGGPGKCRDQTIAIR